MMRYSTQNSTVQSLFLVIILCLNVSITFGQQNFFNVPSSEITEKRKVFFQQQFNLLAQQTVSNSTFCYGLTENTEIGFNFLGITYLNNKHRFAESLMDETPSFPTAGMNAQTQFPVSPSYKIGLGGQYLRHVSSPMQEWYLYVNNRLIVNDYKLICGLFLGNNNYFGEGKRLGELSHDVGIQMGIEANLWRDKLLFQADYITGKTALSNLIIGGAYKINTHWILSSGYQIANSSYSVNGLVLEITFVQ